MMQFILNINPQRGFNDITLLLNGSGSVIDTYESSDWGTEAGAPISDGIVKDETLPDGRVVTISVQLKAVAAPEPLAATEADPLPLAAASDSSDDPGC